MVFDASAGLTWILFLALFSMAYFWLRAAWRIQVRRDYSEVALKRGISPANPAKFAPYAMFINLAAGCIAAAVVVGVLLGRLHHDIWTAIAAGTIWCKFIANLMLSRHAHAAPARSKA